MDDELKGLLEDVKSGLEDQPDTKKSTDGYTLKLQLSEPPDKKEEMTKSHQEMKSWFDNLVETVKAIKLNPEIKVSAPQVNVPAPVVNVPAPKVTVNTPDTIKVSEPTWLESMIRSITKPILEALDKIKFPKEAKDAIPVRISDGEKFIDAFTKAGETIITGGGGGTPTIKSTSNSQVRAVAVVNPDGSDLTFSNSDVDVTTNTNYARKYYTSAGAVTDGIIWSPAASKRWHVVTMYIQVSADATVTLEDDKAAGDDPIWKGEIAGKSGVVLSFTERYPMASGEDAADLTITTNTGNVYITVVGYEI